MTRRSVTAAPSRRRAALLVTGLLLTAGCGGDGGASAGSTTSTTAYTPTTILRPVTAEELDVPVDPDGRPYDAAVVGEVEIDVRPVGVFHFGGGAVHVMDGNGYTVDPSAFESEVVTFPRQDLEVSVVWERRVEHGSEGPLGVRIDVPGAEVARWSRFEFAYGTDGGQGAVTNGEVIRQARDLTDDEWWVPDPDHDADVQVFDRDGLEGPDSLVFSNGFGDGAFPMTKGLDRDGDLVSLLVWDPRYPWRLAVPDGTPPPDVTEREDEILDCIAGRRPVLVFSDESLQCE